jgi:hypothetical protein
MSAMARSINIVVTGSSIGKDAAPNSPPKPPATPARAEASRIDGRFLGAPFKDLSAIFRHS